MAGKRTVFFTPWFEIKATGGEGDDAYYTFRSPDSVMVLPITREGRVLVVRQWRLARDRVTTELPAGGMDDGEMPEQAARRELLEETGYGGGTFTPLGLGGSALQRDESRLHLFFAEGVEVLSEPEPGIDVVALTWDAFREAVLAEGFEDMVGVSAVLFAVWRGLLPRQTLFPT
jgi:8-oxo-dGTP pyrophosphatase MutT (NUDIX family)